MFVLQYQTYAIQIAILDHQCIRQNSFFIKNGLIALWNVFVPFASSGVILNCAIILCD